MVFHRSRSRFQVGLIRTRGFVHFTRGCLMQIQIERFNRFCGGRMLSLLAMFFLSAASISWAADVKRTIGLSPLVSNVADIPAEAAQELFINALMQTNRFMIGPPDANGSFVGAEYVLEPTVNQGKSKSNVLGFLKDTVTSKAPISLDIRVFDARSNALVTLVTVQSSEVKSGKVTLGDIQSVMGAAGAGGEQPSDAAKLEERIGGVMLQAANRLAAQLIPQLGSVGSGPRVGTPRSPVTR